MAAARLTAVATAALLTASCAGQNVNTATFATMSEAREARAVERGWVPAVLPERAYELRAAYDLDGWRRWGILNFHADEADALRQALEPDELSFDGIRLDIPGRIEWWPVALRGSLDAERLATTGLKGYRAREGRLFFAVNWRQGRAYYWATGP